MGVYAFCPKCEEKVMVGFHQYYLESDPAKFFHFLYCGKCDLILNMDRWVKVTVVQHEDEEDVGCVPPFWVSILNLLPHKMLSWFNRLSRWATGSYFMPDPTTEMEVPEIVDSVITQVEKMSGENFSGDYKDFEEFMDRGIKAIVQPGEHVHAH